MSKYTAVAKRNYREAWEKYLTANDETKAELERIMNAAQEHIAWGPADPKWIEFIKTLPGFISYWDKKKREALDYLGAVSLEDEEEKE